MSSNTQQSVWRPLSLDFLFRNYTLRDKKLSGILIAWALLTCALILLTVYLHRRELLHLTVEHIDAISIIAFNPVYIIGILLLLWLGFEWGFIPVYLSTFVATVLSGVSIFWSSVISLAFVLGLVFFALAYHSFRFTYTMRDLKSISAFIIVAFLAALASSLGSFIWSFFNQFSPQDAMVFWKRWWTGTFFQSILIGLPLLYLLSPAIERFKSNVFDLPEISEISVKWIYSSVISVALTLAFFIFSSYWLGRLSLVEVTDNLNVVSAAEIMGAVEAFEIITWTSIGLIIIISFSAFYLVNTWNRSLKEEVNARTIDLEKNRIELEKSLNEKEILFKEIQHRVKNNLAQVHGLLELQETMSSDQEVSKLLKVSKSRIRTMSLAHEALYNSDDFSNISLNEYLQKIAEVTHNSFKDHSKNLRLVCEIDDITVKMAKAIPLGLMVSEILINAHKHAFNGKEDGTITIRCVLNKNEVSLSIADNGCGIPDDYDITTSSSLGMMLIESFTAQLHADLDVNSNSDGTSFNFSIPKSSIYSV